MPLTGRKVFIITASAFGVIIAVNITMAVLAVGSFPGLEVKNSYVASQTFNDDKAAQEALGWTVDADVEDGLLTIAFTGRSGYPVEVESLEAILGRATHVKDDFEPDFSYRDGTFTAPVDLAPGNWNIRMVATAPDGTPFRQRIALHVVD
ncbi:FixH family protein [Tropicimonas sediminicola]|uniref:Nitrogen fixation protein FixH n=1 Tax=Tropicimonas sediminicola TaxID=1031541 RepID=A0A239C213_9RHOB|nr:FixH family protein [Tropicimonas sediminicola]SNS14196.1 Nitrogen fixation protein FixH [Tropicimonas sediminicola]